MNDDEWLLISAAERDYVSAALRTARDLDAGEEEWQRFVEELRKRKG